MKGQVMVSSRAVSGSLLVFALLASVSVQALPVHGDQEVREAMALLVENQLGAKALLKKHIAVIVETRVELSKNFSEKYDPGAREKAFFAGEGLTLGRKVYGQMAVIKRLLKAAESATDPRVINGRRAVKKLQEVQEAYLTVATTPVEKSLSFEAMGKAMNELDAMFLSLRSQVPDWCSQVDLEKALATHAKAIAVEGARAVFGPQSEQAETISREEYAQRKKARDEAEAAKAAQREARLKEIRERQAVVDAERQKEEERLKSMPPPPPPPVVIPAGEMQTVKAWHKNYTIKTSTFKKTLETLMSLDRSRRSKDLITTCGFLATQSEALLVSRELVSKLDRLDSVFQKMLQAYKHSAAECSGGQIGGLEAGLRNGQAAFGELRELLAPYGVAP